MRASTPPFPLHHLKVRISLENQSLAIFLDDHFWYLGFELLLRRGQCLQMYFLFSSIAASILDIE